MTNRIAINTQAPDFELADWSGQAVRLSDYRRQKHIVLVFNRGFV
jgi:peroxiredoxin